MSIKVTNISVDVTGYTALAWETSSLKANFNGTTKNVGNLLGGMTNMSAANASGLSNNIVLKLTNNTSNSKDFYITNISITYTITPNAPTIKQSTETISVSLTNENKLDMTNLIGVGDVTDFMPVAFTSNSFSDPEGISSTGAYTFTGKYFYATKAGVYTFTNPYISAKKDCHEKSATTTGTLTITVNRLDQTLTMANGQVNATTDKSNPTKLDLSTLCTQVGNGTVKYELISAPNALDGTSAKDSCVINGKHFHAWVAGTYTLRASASKTAQYNAATPKEFKVTVNRVTNTLAFYKSEDVRYVEQTVNGAVSTNSNATINTSTTDGSLAYYDAAQNKIFIPNSNNQSFDSKVVTLKVWQEATDVYTASAEKTLTLTVLKYDNSISISGFDNAAHEIKTDHYDNELVLKADNTDYAHYPIYNERISGDDTQASFGEQGENNYWVVYTGQNTGVVEWRLWQNENYKYKAGETTFMVNVINNPNCTCNLVDLSWDNAPTVSSVGNIDFNGIGETLSFELDRNLAAGNAMRYRLWTNNSWSGYESAMDSSVLGGFTAIGPIALGQGENNTTAVEFAKGSNWITGLNTDDPYINNIKVTRKRWMKIKSGSTTEITSLPKMERDVDADPKDAIFYVDFSTCDTIVKVTSDCDHITFGNNLNRDTIAYNTATVATRGFNDVVAVPVYYYSDVAEEKTVTITIYTEYENKTITVPVKTIGYVFEGTTDDDWTKASNWNLNKVPTEIHDVTIEAAAVVSAEQTVRRMDITTGSVTIAPQGGLTIGAGGVTGSTTDNLILKADADAESKTKGQTGYLRLSPEYQGTMPQAAVELYSTAYYDMSVSNHNQTGEWQFVGYPMRGGASAKTVFNKSFLYDWNTTTSAWVNNRKNCVLQPFQGYATSQYRNEEGWLITFTGELVENMDTVISLAYNEGSEFTHNMIANSYVAPIDIANFDDKDFSGIQAAVYIFNTGSREDIKKLGEMRSGSCNIAGQYLSIPIGSARDMKAAFSTPTVIAPMQGFCVHATEKGAFLRLNYESLVWNAANKNTPLHAPSRYAEEPVGSLCVSLYSEGVADNLYMLESDKYDVAFENGYDAKKMNSGEANIYSIVGEDQLAVNATNNFIGTQIGVRTGDTTAYVMTFTHLNSERMLALIDKETNEQIDIFEGTEYTFFAVPNSEINDRFLIVASATAPEITTGIEETNNGIKAYKFIQNGQLFILKNGMLYTASGALVR
ncbi:MAG: hypothetical protein IJQ95_02235 [Paludibacteraceae bacterium]|nr:hypothetical protein [Paludibacteraceae bacterium]